MALMPRLISLFFLVAVFALSPAFLSPGLPSYGSVSARETHDHLDGSSVQIQRETSGLGVYDDQTAGSGKAEHHNYRDPPGPRCSNTGTGYVCLEVPNQDSFNQRIDVPPTTATGMDHAPAPAEDTTNTTPRGATPSRDGETPSATFQPQHSGATVFTTVWAGTETSSSSKSVISGIDLPLAVAIPANPHRGFLSREPILTETSTLASFYDTSHVHKQAVKYNASRVELKVREQPINLQSRSDPSILSYPGHLITSAPEKSGFVFAQGHKPPLGPIEVASTEPEAQDSPTAEPLYSVTGDCSLTRCSSIGLCLDSSMQSTLSSFAEEASPSSSLLSDEENSILSSFVTSVATEMEPSGVNDPISVIDPSTTQEISVSTIRTCDDEESSTTSMNSTPIAQSQSSENTNVDGPQPGQEMPTSSCPWVITTTVESSSIVKTPVGFAQSTFSRSTLIVTETFTATGSSIISESAEPAHETSTSELPCHESSTSSEDMPSIPEQQISSSISTASISSSQTEETPPCSETSPLTSASSPLTTITLIRTSSRFSTSTILRTSTTLPPPPIHPTLTLTLTLTSHETPELAQQKPPSSAAGPPCKPCNQTTLTTSILSTTTATLLSPSVVTKTITKHGGHPDVTTHTKRTTKTPTTPNAAQAPCSREPCQQAPTSQSAPQQEQPNTPMPSPASTDAETSSSTTPCLLTYTHTYPAPAPDPPLTTTGTITHDCAEVPVDMSSVAAEHATTGSSSDGHGYDYGGPNTDDVDTSGAAGNANSGDGEDTPTSAENSAATLRFRGIGSPVEGRVGRRNLPRSEWDGRFWFVLVVGYVVLVIALF